MPPNLHGQKEQQWDVPSKIRSNIIAAQKQDEEFERIASKGRKSGNKAPRTIIVEDKGTTEIFRMDFEISLAQQKDSDQNSSKLMPQYSQIQVQTKLSTLFLGS